MVGQKFWFLKGELLDYQQKTINKPSDGFDRFFPVGVPRIFINWFRVCGAPTVLETLRFVLCFYKELSILRVNHLTYFVPL